MYYNNKCNIMTNNKLYIQQVVKTERFLDPNDIIIPPGYKIEAFAHKLDTPIGIAFTEDGDILIADDGILTDNPKVLLLSKGNFKLIADGFNVPITGINYRNKVVYVSHRGVITTVKMDGTKQDIISGLPSNGDYCNNKVDFDVDGKMYFGQGTATNSGVVGVDNEWVLENCSFFHDQPGSYIMLQIPAGGTAITGAYSPKTWYGFPDYAGGELVTLPKFAPAGGEQPEILFTNHPSVPPKPFAYFPPYCGIMGLDYNKNPDFGVVNDMYIAEFGNQGRNTYTLGEDKSEVGNRIAKVDMNTGEITTFAINKSGYQAYAGQGGGLSRKTDVEFGPDGAMYVVDYAITTKENPYNYIPNTGVIWKITKN